MRSPKLTLAMIVELKGAVVQHRTAIYRTPLLHQSWPGAKDLSRRGGSVGGAAPAPGVETWREIPIHSSIALIIKKGRSLSSEVTAARKEMKNTRIYYQQKPNNEQRVF